MGALQVCSHCSEPYENTGIAQRITVKHVCLLSCCHGLSDKNPRLDLMCEKR